MFHAILVNKGIHDGIHIQTIDIRGPQRQEGSSTKLGVSRQPWLTLSVFITTKSIGMKGSMPSRMECHMDPNIGKTTGRKGPSHRAKNHYQHRVVLIESVFWKYRQKSVTIDKKSLIHWEDFVSRIGCIGKDCRMIVQIRLFSWLVVNTSGHLYHDCITWFSCTHSSWTYYGTLP
jgi:hypothetical protein